MDKNQIRESLLEKRNKLTKEKVIEKGNLVKDKLFSLEEYKKAKTVMFFVSFRKEVYTHDAIKEALKDKTVIVPKIIDFEVVPCIINDFNKLEEGKYRILEPVEVDKADKIDLILVPGMAFDKKGFRIGYGHGYYDRFLKDKGALKIGLCMDFQIIDKMEHKAWDIPMDMIISEKQIIRV